MKGLIIWSGALASLMAIIIGGMIPSAILLPRFDLIPNILTLNSSWQIPALLICSLVCGPKTGIITAIAYLTIGLFYLPIFHGGGSIGYLLTPDFGYLAGFIPAAFVSGSLNQRVKKDTLIYTTGSALSGLIAIHVSGILNLIIGTILSRWPFNLVDLFISYTVAPFPSQLILCPCIALISIALKGILFIK